MSDYTSNLHIISHHASPLPDLDNDLPMAPKTHRMAAAAITSPFPPPRAHLANHLGSRPCLRYLSQEYLKIHLCQHIYPSPNVSRKQCRNVRQSPEDPLQR